jgi:hypothetical protein
MTIFPVQSHRSFFSGMTLLLGNDMIGAAIKGAKSVKGVKGVKRGINEFNPGEVALRRSMKQHKDTSQGMDLIFDISEDERRQP